MTVPDSDELPVAGVAADGHGHHGQLEGRDLLQAALLALRERLADDVIAGGLFHLHRAMLILLVVISLLITATMFSY